ncbi:hypothetical protein B0A55_12982, partial [Friedmanniomyces simplex]
MSDNIVVKHSVKKDDEHMSDNIAVKHLVKKDGGFMSDNRGEAPVKKGRRQQLRWYHRGAPSRRRDGGNRSDNTTVKPSVKNDDDNISDNIVVKHPVKDDDDTSSD